MLIRLGYVALPLSLGITSSNTITYTEFIKQNRPFDKLHQIIEKNLSSLYEIIKFNIKNDIHFFRITSKLIPLATHPDVEYDYITPHLKSFQKIAQQIKKHNIRVDFHPDQFTVLNSTNPTVLENTKRILQYHVNILKALEVENPILILHVGSNSFGKKNSIRRFINNFYKLDPTIQKCIAVENDDKIFTIEDVIEIHKETNVPIVLDYHHYICNHQSTDLAYYLKIIQNSWKHQTMKIHFSSPKGKLKKDIRSHHDYIDSIQFIRFLEMIKSEDIDLDIMIEAKAKEEALFRLVRMIRYQTNYNFYDSTTFSISKP